VSELQADLLKIIVEKGLLGLLLGGLAFYVQRTLDTHRARNVYYQKLAEEKLSALKEVSLIYSQQLVLLGNFLRVLERANADTPEKRDDSARQLMSAYNAFAQHYRDQAPVLLRNTIFASRDLGDRMIAHQKRLGQLVEVVEAFATRKSAEPPHDLPEPPQSLVETLAELQHAIASEIRIPPTIEDRAS